MCLEEIKLDKQIVMADPLVTSALSHVSDASCRLSFEEYFYVLDNTDAHTWPRLSSCALKY